MIRTRKASWAANERGVALSIVIITLLMLSIVASSILSASLNKKKLSAQAVSGRTASFYEAKSGIVDAYERINRNLGGPANEFASGQFTTSTFNPPEYQLDIDADSVKDVAIDISEVKANGFREIKSKNIIS